MTDEHRLEIDAYLENVARSNVEFGAVIPDADVRSRIEEEIATKSGCKAEPLATDAATGRAIELRRRSISASPRTFVEETKREIERIASELRSAGAKKFEIQFANPDIADRSTDRILIGVRYLKS